MTDATPSTTSAAPSDSAPAVDEPRGLGGWMILPTIGTLLAPLRILSGVVEDVGTSSDRWDSIAPALKTFIAIETVLNIVFAIAWICCAVLLFRRRRLFPIVFIVLMVGGIAYQLVDSAIVFLAFNTSLSGQMFTSMTSSAIGCFIWIPYMLVSRRVENTFVN